MIGVPTNFQAVSNVLANYDFVDIVAGTGIINFYAGNTIDLNLLSNFNFYSNTVASGGATGVNGNWIKVLDHDYNIIINRPINVYGLGIVNVPIVASSTGLNYVCQCYVIIILRKFSGGGEADIISNTSSIASIQSAAGSTFLMTSTDLDIPLTHFKIGETLRLTIELWGMTTSNNAGDVGYAHDPMNRTTDWDSTGAVPSKLVFQCPVRLNL